MSQDLRDFLSLSYGELEELNLNAKEQRNEPRSGRDRSRKSASST